MSDVIVSVPARADFLHVVRAVVGCVGARLDYGYDVIEDLRLAVDEACASLLAIPAPATTLTLRIRPTEAGIEFEAATDAVVSDGWPPPNLEASLAWRVLSALADEARFERGPEGPVLRLTKRAAAAGGAE